MSPIDREGRRLRPSATPRLDRRRSGRRSATVTALAAVAVLGGLVLSLVGCGYSLVGRGTNLPEDVEGIYVAPFENRTQRQQVEQFVTEAIAEELVRRPRYRVVGEADSDATLSGAVSAFGLTPIAFDADGRATEYEISVTAQVALARTGDSDQVLWKNDRYVFRENYQVDTGEGGFLDLEDLALRDAAERFAETMVSDLLEGF